MTGDIRVTDIDGVPSGTMWVMGSILDALAKGQTVKLVPTREFVTDGGPRRPVVVSVSAVPQ